MLFVLFCFVLCVLGFDLSTALPSCWLMLFFGEDAEETTVLDTFFGPSDSKRFFTTCAAVIRPVGMVEEEAR